MEPPAEAVGPVKTTNDQQPHQSGAHPPLASTAAPNLVQLFVPQFTSPTIIEVKNSLAPDPKWAPRETYFVKKNSPHSIYGYTRFFHMGKMKMLFGSSHSNQLFIAEVNNQEQAKLSLTEVPFTDIMPDAHIIAVHAFKQHGLTYQVLLLVAIASVIPGRDGSADTYRLNVYGHHCSQLESFGKIAENFQSITVDFVPFQLSHVHVFVGGKLATGLLLSGSDQKFHLYLQHKVTRLFAEVNVITYVPELAQPLSRCATCTSVRWFGNRRLIAVGFQTGHVQLLISDSEGVVQQRHKAHLDGPITAMTFFTVETKSPLQLTASRDGSPTLEAEVNPEHPIIQQVLERTGGGKGSAAQERPSPPRGGRTSSPSSKRSSGSSPKRSSSSGNLSSLPSTSTPLITPQPPPKVHLLVTGAIGFAILYSNILEEGLEKSALLPRSDHFDAVLCAEICDIDYDDKNEIVLGTFGQELLVYKNSFEKEVTLYCWFNQKVPYIEIPRNLDTGGMVSYELRWRRSFPSPVSTVSFSDFTGNGLNDLFVGTATGVHLLQFKQTLPDGLVSKMQNGLEYVREVKQLMSTKNAAISPNEKVN